MRQATRLGAASVAILLSLVGLSRAADEYAGRYYCVEEFGGGVSFNSSTGKWESTTFRPESKFVLRVDLLTRRDDKLWGTIGTYQVGLTKQGVSDVSACVALGGQSGVDSLAGNMWCEADFAVYRFNLKSLRYLSSYEQGYVGGADNNDDTPSMMAGTCTKID
jgi:hypothetical protein